MAIIIAANNVSSSLAYPINSTTTTVILASGTGAKFPTPGADQVFTLSLTDAATKLQHEIMWCTFRNGDTLTVLRGQEGTTAQAWAAGDIASNLPTAGTIASTVQVDQLQQNVYQFGVAGGSADAMTLTLTSALTQLYDGMEISFRSVGTNQTNTPSMTLTLNGVAIGPLNIMKGNNIPVAVGDIQGPNADTKLQYNSTYVSWTLMNPASAPIPSTFYIPVGSMYMWPTSTAPSGWVLCNGAAVSRTVYSGLFSVIGITFGAGDGSTTFNLPNMTNNFAVGAGGSYGLGATGGTATNTLITANLPAHNHGASSLSSSISTSSSTSSFTGNALPTHNHSAQDSGHQHSYVTYGAFAPQTGSSTPCWFQTSSANTGVGFANVTIGQTSAGTPTGSVATSTTTNTSTTTTTTTSNTGSGTAVNNIPPYLALYFIIKT